MPIRNPIIGGYSGPRRWGPQDPHQWILLTWFTQFAFASGDRCTGWQVRKGGFVPISDLPLEEQHEEEAGI